MKFYWNNFTKKDFVDYCAKMKNNNVEILKEAWKETKKVHKSIVKDHIEVVKCITKTIFGK